MNIMMLDSSLKDRTDGESRVQSHAHAEGFLQLHINCYGSFHTRKSLCTGKRISFNAKHYVHYNK